MADYGVDTTIPNNANPSQLTQPTPQPAAPAPQDHPFNGQALDDAFDKAFTPDQGDVQKLQASTGGQWAQQSGSTGQNSGVNAVGSPSDIAQASIGRNVNERLQIWSKLVGDKNAMIGPPINGQNDVWIRGQDGKFHPADTGHTDFMQDLAKKTGAGIDTVVQSVSALAGAGAGAVVGAPEIGAAAGYAAGPGLSSASRQFLMSRYYGVKPNPEQLKRDMYIGGAMNLFAGGLLTGAGNVASNVATSIEDSSASRMSTLAKSQVEAKNFMDAVGAQPAEVIDSQGNVNAPMSNAGERLFSATQIKRQQLNDLISTTNEQIVAANNNKVNTQGLASVVKDFMQKDGYRFDDMGMPVPYESYKLGIEAVPDQETRLFMNQSQADQLPSVNMSRIDRPRMGTDAMNDLAEDYKALASGQMDMGNFLQMTRDWQENAKFKPLDMRSDATRSGWAELQHTATSLRQQEIQTRLQNDPQMLNAVNDAYHEYSSSKDAIDMIYDAYRKNQNSPEKLAQLFVQPGKQELLSQAKSLFADKPQVMKDVRSAWLSEKMGKYVGNDGVFNSNAFIGDLKKTGGETLNQLFEPGELGNIYRSAKIMGSVKTSDLMSQAQGQNVVDAIGNLADSTGGASLSRPWAVMKWLENKPKFSEYMCSPDGLSKLAAQKPPAVARILNNMSTALKNKAAQSAAAVAIKNTKNGQNIYNSMNPLGAFTPIKPPAQGTTGSEDAMDQAFGANQ